ncbi:MAG: insulinase family protein [Armatimonadetes bacterium]|nr:insulinase family protein [Armatimonadota bacterium]
MGVNKHVLDNGVRVLTESVGHVGSLSVGLWCRTGSVNEDPHEGGITHLIEHMLFKGTKHRTAKQIAEEIEGRGGMLNAFTDKEQTCYYCRVLATEAESAVDVLCDMVNNSLFDPAELEREKGVVLEEIKRGEDEPSDQVHDLHMEGLWHGHELGKPIIGTRDSVSSFKRDDITTYVDRRYKGNNVLFAAAGNIDADDLTAKVAARLGDLPKGEPTPKLRRPSAAPGENLVSKDVEQVHFCIGSEGVSIYDDELYTMGVMDSVLGSGMSSRLFQEVREKRGLVYAIGSYSLAYSAGGAFTVYGGTSPKTWNQVREVVATEFAKLIKDGVPKHELDKVKRSMSGTLVLGLEGMSARMTRMAKNEFVHGREVPVEETLAKIEAVSADDVVNLATRILQPEKIRTTAIGAF